MTETVFLLTVLVLVILLGIAMLFLVIDNMKSVELSECEISFLKIFSGHFVFRPKTRTRRKK